MQRESLFNASRALAELALGVTEGVRKSFSCFLHSLHLVLAGELQHAAASARRCAPGSKGKATLLSKAAQEGLSEELQVPAWGRISAGSALVLE